MLSREKRSITLDQIEARVTDSEIVKKMILGYFDRLNLPDTATQDDTLTISCVDSRIPPAPILGQDRGQAYAVQTVANVVPKLDMSKPFEDQHIEVAAALEYAVKHKNVDNIIVLGHTDCGGAEARLVPDQTLPHVNLWMNHVCMNGLHVHDSQMETVQTLKKILPGFYEEARRGAERNCLNTSIANIREMPFIADAIANTRLSLAGVICEIETGALKIFHSDNHAISNFAMLIQKSNRYKNEAWGENGHMHDLAANGQFPKGLIVTGISPHVAPENVFGIEAGDALIHRRIGGHYHHERTPDGLAATIEFAISAKNVKSLVFVGNRNDVNLDYANGNIDQHPVVKAFMEKSTPEIRQWRDYNMRPDKIHENSMRSTHFNAMKHPSVKDAFDNGRLSVISLLADHEQQTLEFYDPEHDEFLMIVPPAV